MKIFKASEEELKKALELRKQIEHDSKHFFWEWIKTPMAKQLAFENGLGDPEELFAEVLKKTKS